MSTQHLPFRSHSGDWFAVPEGQFQVETRAYAAAVAESDDDTMLRFEEGWTGWTFVNSARDATLYRGPAGQVAEPQGVPGDTNCIGHRP